MGVARQYCGQLGKTENCQVAVSLSLCTERGSFPLGCRVYLPREWPEDPARCVRVGVPPEVEFATKEGDCACAHRGGAGRRPPRPCVLADAA